MLQEMRSKNDIQHCPIIFIVPRTRHISKHCIFNQWIIPDVCSPFSLVHYTQKLRLDDPGFKVRIRYTKGMHTDTHTRARCWNVYLFRNTKKQKQRNSNWVLNYKLPFEHPEKKIPGKRDEETKGSKVNYIRFNRITKNALNEYGVGEVGW
jgi:hypothetical protein